MNALAVATNFIRDLMPDGFFWRGEAGDRFIAAMAGAYEDFVQWIIDLADAMNPAKTPYRSVLLQYWAYFENDCIAIPEDTEELRSLVLTFISIRAIETPAALEAFIEGLLPFAEFSESLPVSHIPSDVPFDVEPTGRVIRIWYPPLIYPAEYINCIARPVAQAADEIQHATPGGVIVSAGSGYAFVDDIGVHWHFVRGVARLRVVVEHASGAILSDELYDVTDEFGVDTLDNMSSMAPTDEAEQTKITVTVQRDYLDGAGYRDLSIFEFENEGYMSDIFAAANVIGGTVDVDNQRNIATLSFSNPSNVTASIAFTVAAQHDSYHVVASSNDSEYAIFHVLNRTTAGFDLEAVDEGGSSLSMDTFDFSVTVEII